MKAGRLVILLAEDEEHDVFFARRALERLGAHHNLYAVPDGAQALRYLRGEGQYADRNKFPMPNIILTDLKMPHMDGFELLRWLQAHPECTVIPTIVYSSSNHETDVRKAYALGANAYLTKPHGLDELTRFLRLTSEFWACCEIPDVPVKC